MKTAYNQLVRGAQLYLTDKEVDQLKAYALEIEDEEFMDLLQVSPRENFNLVRL